jgi:hypothetical protein
MTHGEMLPSNADDPHWRASSDAPAEDADPEARMQATPGEPGLSKVPSITQAMLRDDARDERETE